MYSPAAATGQARLLSEMVPLLLPAPVAVLAAIDVCNVFSTKLPAAVAAASSSGRAAAIASPYAYLANKLDCCCCCYCCCRPGKAPVGDAAAAAASTGGSAAAIAAVAGGGKWKHDMFEELCRREEQGIEGVCNML